MQKIIHCIVVYTFGSVNNNGDLKSGHYTDTGDIDGTEKKRRKIMFTDMI